MKDIAKDVIEDMVKDVNKCEEIVRDGERCEKMWMKKKKPTEGRRGIYTHERS
jgi:hypothetical protein